MMSGLVEPKVMLILSWVQVALYGLTALLGCFKLLKARTQTHPFLPSFFALVCVITLIQLALQIYQVIIESAQNSPDQSLLIIVNIYAMLFEAAALFLLADYWGETSEILTKQSTEHWVRPAVLLICAAVFTAFVIWGEVSDSLNPDTAASAVLALGCQGLAVVLVLWANIMQIIKGHSMSVALKRYEDWVSSLSTKKIQFCCLFWVSSSFNLLRSLFLIAATLVIEFGYEEVDYEWLFGYVYAFTNIPILATYLLGFSTHREEIKQSTLIEDNARENSPKKRRETELSNSRSSRSSV